MRLTALLHTLEQRVEERTAEAEAARHRAESASLAKSRFLATMSHEIRTPMNGVIGMADFLSTTDLNEEQQSSVATIQAASGNLRRLLDDVLDLSRLESGKLDLSPTTFSPAELIEDLVALHSPTAHQRGLLLRAEVEGTLPLRVTADRMRVSQVVGNLLSNAVKFTDKGSVRLLVHFDQNDFHISVVDTGVGIRKAARAHLFQRFSQADSSTSRMYGGSGLGLAICRELVRAMGGSIEFDATVTSGTRVNVTIPVVVFGEAETERSETVQAPAEAIPGGLSDLRVLVVDDNRVNVMVAYRLLEWLGCTVDARSDGVAAVEAVVEGEFDAVLMDLHMPGIDGYEATERLHARLQAAGRDAPPVFALTADAVEGVAERCAAHGMQGMIPKPVTREILYRHLRHLV